MHRLQPFVQFGQVLAALEVLEQIASRPFLTVGHCLEHAVPVEKTGDLGQTLLEARLCVNGRHRGDRPSTIPSTGWSRTVSHYAALAAMVAMNL